MTWSFYSEEKSRQHIIRHKSDNAEFNLTNADLKKRLTNPGGPGGPMSPFWPYSIQV